MPDLINRSKHEQQMATAAYLILRRWGEEFDDDFNMFDFREQFEEALVPSVAGVYQDAASNMGVIHGADLERFKLDVKSVRWATKYSRKLAREVSRSIRDELEATSRIENPYEYDQRIKDIFGRTRAEKIGVTETTSGISIGERSVIDEIERQTGVGLKAYWQTEVAGVCKICKGLRNKSERIWKRKFPFGPPAHPWCVPADGLVVPMGKLAAASKAFYVGDCVETRLANGARFTVTKNHPVLTKRGWVPAGSLNLADEVAYASRPERVAAVIGPDDRHMVTSIEDVFNSLVKTRGMASSAVPSTTEQFHGDGAGMNGEVEIVNIYGKLSSEFDSFCDEHFLKCNLGWRSGRFPAVGSRSLAQPGNWDRSPPDGGMGGIEQGPFLFIGGRGPSKQHRLGPVAGLDTGLAENRSNRHSSYAAGLRQRQYAGAFDEKPHDGISRQAGMQESLFDLGPELGPDGDQLASQRSWLDLQLASDFVHRFTGEVAFLRIADIFVVPYRGHVYDLQCPEFDLYSCNGAIVHNCRCWLLYR